MLTPEEATIKRSRQPLAHTPQSILPTRRRGSQRHCTIRSLFLAHRSPHESHRMVGHRQ